MKVNNETDIIRLIEQDYWMMDILHYAKSLKLPDWWICAGFVRSKIWDELHGFTKRTPLSDIDVIYYDPNNLKEETEKEYEDHLRALNPAIPWSVKNEARMHLRNNVPPYESSIDAISKFPETATSLGVKLDSKDRIILTAPYGVHDVIHLEVRPTPYILENQLLATLYKERILNKNWISTWTNLKIFHC
ncbi:nucleotidyltransferase family protein [Bacillus sp. FJAT-49732]|uniref:Nucleotidyltransferase family protein n=1 Tax=Lederbergia citrisecunda TaxID=2833583 RepID=A0A942TNF5_9BACI|nr:nucleotidyltransferase family protein [Lederbergia citrisecunda]MBS4200785.1 nucleotidyltransferase family protein [Lederbergia citrisecunda]